MRRDRFEENGSIKRSIQKYIARCSHLFEILVSKSVANKACVVLEVTRYVSHSMCYVFRGLNPIIRHK